MPAIADHTVKDALLLARDMLEGEDDYTMGDPDPSVGDVRWAIYALTGKKELRETLSVDRISVASDAVDAEFVRLCDADKAESDRVWLAALRALPNADKPLSSLSAVTSKLLIDAAAQLRNLTGGRRNALHGLARDSVLCDLLDEIVAGSPSGPATETLARFARALREGNMRTLANHEIDPETLEA